MKNDREASVLDQVRLVAALPIEGVDQEVDLDRELQRQIAIAQSDIALEKVHKRWERAGAYNITTNLARVKISDPYLPVLEIPIKPGASVPAETIMGFSRDLKGTGITIVEFVSEEPYKGVRKGS